MNADVSLFPVFKSQVLAMVNELEAVYVSTAPVGNKSNDFHQILRKYGCA
jgi:hypothetical protein